MLRSPLHRICALKVKPWSHQIGSTMLKSSSAVSAVPDKATEKIEVFVDDIPVMVDPGTTVLQAAAMA